MLFYINIVFGVILCLIGSLLRPAYFVVPWKDEGAILVLIGCLLIIFAILFR